MSQLTKAQFDSTYNQSNSGSFKNNTDQLITAGTIRQFSKDIEDSIPFLLGTNTFTVSNAPGIIVTGNTTLNNIGGDIAIQRSGAASVTVGAGPNIELQNTTSNKYIILQSSDDVFQIFGYNSSAWSERARIDATGMLRLGQIGTTLAVADASIGLVKAGYTTSDNTVFHIAGFFEAEQTAATTFSIQGVEGYTKVSHGSGTVTLAIGTIGNIELASTHTLSIARSLQAGGNTSAAGTITEWDGIYVGIANTGGAAITSFYGLYIDTFPSGITNKWGVYVAESLAVNYFAGKVKYGTDGTGGGSALLGTNCPASTLTAPYKWITALSSDGSTVYIPAWK